LSDPGQGNAKRFYGRRRGHRLTPRQCDLLDNLLPRLRVRPDGFVNGRPDVCPAGCPLNLEIGFGGGEHLAAQAGLRPNECFVGCEPFVNGVAKLLSRIEQDGLDNVFVHPDDVWDLLPGFGTGTVRRIFILYPDPWPKARHRKRRLINDSTVDELARILEPGGVIRFATDIDDYVDWALRRFLRHPALSWQAQNRHDWRTRPADWPETRYESKARRDGRPCTYLQFERLPPAARPPAASAAN